MALTYVRIAEAVQRVAELSGNAIALHNVISDALAILEGQGVDFDAEEGPFDVDGLGNLEGFQVTQQEVCEARKSLRSIRYHIAQNYEALAKMVNVND
jgi:hypothetical protein